MTGYKIYKITNCLDGKIYVGQTKQTIEKRFLQHLHADSPLGQAMRQFGAENFTIEVIEKCENQEHLNEREKFWIKTLNCKIPNGCNVREGGEVGKDYVITDRMSCTMRLPAEDYSKLRILAKKNKRSMAAELEYILEMYFEKYELQNGQVLIEDSSLPVNNHQIGNNNLFVNHASTQNVVAV